VTFKLINLKDGTYILSDTENSFEADCTKADLSQLYCLIGIFTGKIKLEETIYVKNNR
jgi:hypothetical protein